MIIGKDKSDEEAAEMLMRHRARTMPFLIAVFIFMQIATAIKMEVTGGLSTGGLSGWLIVCFVMLNVVATGGASFARRPGIRRYIDDELTLSHRFKAYSLAFWAIMAASIGLLALSMWREIDTVLAIHTLIGIGVVAASARYTLLERRALRS